MNCPKCKQFHSRNTWQCFHCNQPINGGVVFITGISGSAVGEKIKDIFLAAGTPGHNHLLRVHDVGELMKKHALRDDPYINWDKILDASPKVLRLLRAIAFQEITDMMTREPETLHVIDLHLSFRWKAYLTKGFEYYLFQGFQPYVRCFINIVEDIHSIKDHLASTAWGNREILELLIWRNEELLLTDMFADVCGRVDSFAVAKGEPAAEIEKLIWHPKMKKVYLSFPITAISGDTGAREEIISFRDRIRDFLMVFDPYACKDYDDTYKRPEMQAFRKQVGETTVDRDFRFIDQADAVVVYYPKNVPSKGVDAEMRHAVETGKPIFLYCPEELGGGPFTPPADHVGRGVEEFIGLLKDKLS